MHRQDTTIHAAHGGTFECYQVIPTASAEVPAVVLASAILGVDKDLRAIADAFGAQGYITAAPDLFWRTVPGPLPRGDARATARAQPRLATISTGEQDLRDVLADLRKLPSFNGRAMVIGFCYGAPYAILGPKRLGYVAGVACHGSGMLDFSGDLEGLRHPVCIVWGDQDHLAPPHVREAYRARLSSMPNLELHVLAGVRHGYMMQSRKDAFDPRAFDFSMQRALAILETMRASGPWTAQTNTLSGRVSQSCGDRQERRPARGRCWPKAGG